MNRTSRVALLASVAVALSATPTPLAAQYQALPAASVELAGDGPVKLPFESYRRWIVIPIQINGAPPLRFILDTGAPIMILGSRAVGERLPLEIVGYASVDGAGDGAPTSVPVAGNVTVESGPLTIRNASMAVGVGEDTIAGVDGIMGGSIFRNLVVEIDWEAGELTLHRPNTYRYSGAGSIHDLELLESGHVVVRAQVAGGGTSSTVTLLVDTGAGHALSLEPPAVAGLAGAPRVRDTVIGWGSNGIARGDVMRVPELRIGPHRLVDIVASVPSGGPWAAIGQSQNVTLDGNLGLRALRRFRVVFDVPGSRLILEPSSEVDAPFRFDTSGIALVPWAPGYAEIHIADVIPGSPADQAGLAIGDRIVAINGTEVAALGTDDVERALWGDPGNVVELRLFREDQTLVRTLALRDIL